MWMAPGRATSSTSGRTRDDLAQPRRRCAAAIRSTSTARRRRPSKSVRLVDLLGHGQRRHPLVRRAEPGVARLSLSLADRHQAVSADAHQRWPREGGHIEYGSSAQHATRDAEERRAMDAPGCRCRCRWSSRIRQRDLVTGVEDETLDLLPRRALGSVGPALPRLWPRDRAAHRRRRDAGSGRGAPLSGRRTRRARHRRRGRAHAGRSRSRAPRADVPHDRSSSARRARASCAPRRRTGGS